MATGGRASSGAILIWLVGVGAVGAMYGLTEGEARATSFVRCSATSYEAFLDRTLTVDILVDNTEGFYEGSVKVFFDPSLLRVVSASFDYSKWNGNIGSVNNAIGSIDEVDFGGYLNADGFPQPPPIFTTRIATVIFQPLGVGASSLNLEAGWVNFPTNIETGDEAHPVFLGASVNTTASTCIPDPNVCQTQGAVCGFVPDIRCGGFMPCGTCASDQHCGPAHSCLAGAQPVPSSDAACRVALVLLLLASGSWFLKRKPSGIRPD